MDASFRVEDVGERLSVVYESRGGTSSKIEQLISDEQIPEDRRVVDAVVFMCGLRFGEAAALRWRHYEDAIQPLGRLAVEASFSVKLHAEKATKTENPRQVPVHPTLAAILAEWKAGGCAAILKREAEADDLILPSREGKNRNVNHALKRFHEDLDRLKLRHRRIHDLRRSFISLCLADGARKDVLRWVTHGPSGDVMDMYTTLPWTALCEAVACLKIERTTRGKVLALHAPAARPAGPVEIPPRPATPAATPSVAANENARNLDDSGRSQEAGWTGLEATRIIHVSGILVKTRSDLPTRTQCHQGLPAQIGRACASPPVVRVVTSASRST